MTMTLRMEIFFSLCHLATGILTYNHTTAIEQCRGHGELASNRHFINNEGRSEYISRSLGEGESAWISGNVRFSKFVSWHGCFDVNSPEISNNILPENNIYNCLENCSSLPGILYIGLQNNLCYCIKWEHLHILKVKSDHECKQQLIEPYVSNYGDSSPSRNITTDVYAIINDKSLYWKPHLPSAHNQCVYVRFEGTATIYVTESCFTPADGFICVRSSLHPLSEQCTTFYPTVNVRKQAFCIVTKQSSWLTSFGDCVNYSGQLVNNVYPWIKGNAQHNVAYWTGIFRSFKIESEEFSMENTVCLSLKKIDNKLVLDPADCSTNKRYICEDGIFENTDSTTLKTTYSHKKTESEPKSSFLTTKVSEKHTAYYVTFLSSPTTMLSKDKETADGEAVPTCIYIAIGVVLTLIFAIVIIIACLILRKRRKVHKSGPYDKTRSKDDHKTTANDSDNNARSASVSHCVEQSQVLIHQHNELAEECTYATTHKALIQHNVPECEYDRVDLNSPGKSTDNTASVKPVDVNVYGIHSGIRHDDETGEYDHLHAVGTKQLAKPRDGIYNTTSAVNDTYNVLTSESKGKSTDRTFEKQPHVDETCATYDKLD